MLFLLPISVSTEGAYSYDRRIAFIIIKLYGVKLFTIKVYFNKEEGVFISLNGKKGKRLGEGKPKRKKPTREINYLALLSGVYLTKVDIALYIGGEPQSISLLLGSIRILLDTIVALINLRRPLDSSRIRLLPCFHSDPVSAKFSITLFTSPVLILFALAHTILGERKCKIKRSET